MKRQKSFTEIKPTLFLVPTPIGNMDDMTFRSVEVLKSVDYIFSEDTRVTKKLLSHFNINTPLFSYHLFNENVQADEILNFLREGKNIALVSDAGLPGISDPGFLITKRAIEADFNVVSLPGANAALTALIASGIDCANFYFFGFLNSKQNQRLKQLKILRDIKETLIFYEAPHRLLFTLNDMLEVFGNREIVIARELTKKFEEYIRGNLEDIIKEIGEIKGEIVIIVDGASRTHLEEDLLSLSIKNHYEYYLKQGLSDKDAMKKVASLRNMPKSDVYKNVKTDEQG